MSTSDRARAGYASSAAEILGGEDLVFGCYSTFAPPPVTVDYAMDDHPDVVDRYGSYAIAPFDVNPEDRELWKVAEQLE
jgi:hypothetical protein